MRTRKKGVGWTPRGLNAPVVSAAQVGTTGLALTWPTAPANQNIAKYVIRYTPGAYIAGECHVM